MNPFSIGDRVLCINNSSMADMLEDGCSIPKEGEIYHVRAIDDDAIYLNEIVNPLIYGLWTDCNNKEGWMEYSFLSWRFVKWNTEEMLAIMEEESELTI